MLDSMRKSTNSTNPWKSASKGECFMHLGGIPIQTFQVRLTQVGLPEIG
jgi:hypothetical protein